MESGLAISEMSMMKGSISATTCWNLLAAAMEFP